MAETYVYRPQAAVGEDGQLTNQGTGQLYAISDTAHATPLVARDVTGASKTVIALSGIGQTETFLIDDHPELWWKSGSTVVHLFSISGILERAETAAASAVAAANASSSSRAAAEAAQSAVAALVASAVRSVNGIAPGADGNVNVAGGGGGSGILTVKGIGPDATGNVPLTYTHLGAAAASHTHAFSSLTGIGGTPSTATWMRGDGTWAPLPSTGGGGGGSVNSVNGVNPDGTGNLTLNKGHLELGAVDNTSDQAKPLSQAAIDALFLKANDNAVVKLTGNQSVAGVKTFTSAPVVPANAFAISKVADLQTTLDAKLSGLNGITAVWGGSKAAYDALPTKVGTVLYFVTGA